MELKNTIFPKGEENVKIELFDLKNQSNEKIGECTLEYNNKGRHFLSKKYHIFITAKC
jgi:hypothetical protein